MTCSSALVACGEPSKHNRKRLGAVVGAAAALVVAAAGAAALVVVVDIVQRVLFRRSRHHTTMSVTGQDVPNTVAVGNKQLKYLVLYDGSLHSYRTIEYVKKRACAPQRAHAPPSRAVDADAISSRSRDSLTPAAPPIRRRRAAALETLSVCRVPRRTGWRCVAARANRRPAEPKRIAATRRRGAPVPGVVNWASIERDTKRMDMGHVLEKAKQVRRGRPSGAPRR